MVKVLIVGSGGREHTLAWKLKQSPLVEKVYCATGNAGTAMLGQNVAIGPEDVHGLLNFASKEGIDFTVVGPEAPLVTGIVDEFEKHDLKIFGPTKAASQLEGSKIFSKRIMEKNNIPTGKAKEFTNPDDAIAYIREQGAPIVVKADGLAAGKGVIIGMTEQAAINTVEDAMIKKRFGHAGDKVLIEEYLQGEEVSILALTDGKTIVPLESSQDHKPIYDDDKGPNTGGMGAYSPAPLVTEEMNEKIYKDVLKPTLDGMNAEGIPFKGVIYAGLIFTEQGPKVLEYNVRFGDPEAQAVIPRLKSDLYPALSACTDNTLHEIKLEWDPLPVCCVVLSSGGYPGSYEKGKEINGLDTVTADEGVVFHAGTKPEQGKVLTNGGRVLGVTAAGQNIAAAIDNTYKIVDKVSFDGAYFRKDIGKKALRHCK